MNIYIKEIKITRRSTDPKKIKYVVETRNGSFQTWGRTEDYPELVKAKVKHPLVLIAPTTETPVLYYCARHIKETAQKFPYKVKAEIIKAEKNKVREYVLTVDGSWK